MSNNQVTENANSTPDFVHLPLLNLRACAGNIGVQIDSYRAKDYFNRPRSDKFTTGFGGKMYEDTRLQNAKRLIEREAKRYRYL